MTEGPRICRLNAKYGKVLCIDVTHGHESVGVSIDANGRPTDTVLSAALALLNNRIAGWPAHPVTIEQITPHL